jgi:hypothetical protein
LPATAGGAIEATLRSGFADPYPTVEVNGARHRTGGPVPLAVRILTLLPMLLVGIGGALGGIVGALGFVANSTVARTRIPSVVKALIMVGVSIVAYVVWLVLAVAVDGAINQA